MNREQGYITVHLFLQPRTGVIEHSFLHDRLYIYMKYDMNFLLH